MENSEKKLPPPQFIEWLPLSCVCVCVCIYVVRIQHTQVLPNHRIFTVLDTKKCRAISQYIKLCLPSVELMIHISDIFNTVHFYILWVIWQHGWYKLYASIWHQIEKQILLVMVASCHQVFVFQFDIRWNHVTYTMLLSHVSKKDISILYWICCTCGSLTCLMMEGMNLVIRSYYLGLVSMMRKINV